ncbi:MAG: L-2,4-diaminobutyrate decarboxylase [Verrucomicrobiales bacterium]|jgi:L-2,4-diaminobutyrate decarboxylase
MHEFDESTDALAEQIFRYARERTRLDPIPLNFPKTEDELRELCGPTITADGIGGSKALQLFTDVLEPASLSVDYTKYLSFVPAAPTEAAVLFDLVVGASSIYGGSWLEGAGAVHGENEALEWLRSISGMPVGTEGVFVSGGTIGNLSALVAARHEAATRLGDARPPRFGILASKESHSSIKAAALVMDCDVIVVETNDERRMTGEAVATALNEHGDAICAVVATSGTTNLGIIDDLRSIGEVCRERGVWFHVDGAYGGAGLATERTHHLFDGLELADSFIVDPHKWLFAPFDCCALLYRHPETAVAAHAQHAGYLAFLDAHGDRNPSDLAIHLTRRVRGLPFWFSLATHGTTAYASAVDATLDLAAAAAQLIREADHVELAYDPSLSVVAFTRTGWNADDYQAWTEKAMSDGLAFVTPSRLDGKPIFRFCFVNPRTVPGEIAEILAAMA